MREIKFRGMDANGVMRYGRLSQDKPNTTVYFSEYSQRICWDDSNIPVSNASLGQYTSLKDKNGKEIYEGDILLNHFRNQKLIVFWDDEDLGTKGGGWGYKKLENDKQMTWRIDEENIEIIGNIYENKELLNENK